MNHNLTVKMSLVVVFLAILGTNYSMAQSNGPPVAAKVTQVEWSPESDKPTEAFAARVATLKDKLLRAEDLLALATNFALYPDDQRPGLIIKAARNKSLIGVRLTFTILPEHARQYWDWKLDEHVANRTRNHLYQQHVSKPRRGATRIHERFY